MGEKLFLLLLLLITVSSSLFQFGISDTSRKSGDGNEEWGYVQVRPKAHMFWWLYRSPFRVKDASKPWPTILWLQGGPGGSGTGFGNFLEIGPLDSNLKPRTSTWLRKADLLFVDNPVGTGYSFVESLGQFAKSDWDAADDMTTLLTKLSNNTINLNNTPFYIFAESYGGKFAVTLALSLLRSIRAGHLKLNLQGVALGDSWISPEDFTFSWGPLLHDLSRIGSIAHQISNQLASEISDQIKKGMYENATLLWSSFENFILAKSNRVDFYNFMLDLDLDPVISTTKSLESNSINSVRLKGRKSSFFGYKNYKPGGEGNLEALMNGPIKQKLKIIPPDVTWGGQSDKVLEFFTAEFMKPRIKEVDELLAQGVNVTIYNGQVDLICSTKGAEAWINKLKWNGLKSFLNTQRTPLFCGKEKGTKGFTRSHQNLNFYWILGAGHFVPVDQPCVTLNMVGAITQSPGS
ncbi:serine carboxypeptidase-like 51 [Cucumis melo var. makuwa]|uniref:Carboxypeptidase n=2 Tax=Cucumis melo TaxID=3656 RepID=A0A1S3CNV9_CUCME|nr:serine carboxypeptidase-like 51 [Cucumis melo]KAA0037294.1 serine carboxypeptidase-like 51 [Cucumis melo var. makuwa]